MCVVMNAHLSHNFYLILGSSLIGGDQTRREVSLHIWGTEIMSPKWDFGWQIEVHLEKSADIGKCLLCNEWTWRLMVMYVRRNQTGQIKCCPRCFWVWILMKELNFVCRHKVVA